MSRETEELARRVGLRVVDLGMSERAASLKSTGQPDTLRFIRMRGVMPSFAKLVQIAEALETTVDYLTGRTEHAVRTEPVQPIARTAVSDVGEFARFNRHPGALRQMSAEYAQLAVRASTTAMSICWLGKARALLVRAASIENEARPVS